VWLLRPDDNKSRVPYEFIGRARVFRDHALAVNKPTLDAIERIYGILAARARRSPIPRKDLLQEAATAWRREIPEFGMLNREIELKRNTLRLVELRVGGGHVHYPHWGVEVEKGIGILRIELRCARHLCEMKSDIFCLVGLHALARWMQRRGDQSEGALLGDLAALADQRERLLEHGDNLDDQSFACHVSGGAWVGQVVRLWSERTKSNERVLSVRSFLSDAQISPPLERDPAKGKEPETLPQWSEDA
jgi:hypothetical protein